MIILKLEIDNLFMFKNTLLDLTYSRKLINPTVDNEYLEGINSFNYKRINVFSGANASGKTSLSKVMCYVINFIDGRDLGMEQIDFKNKFYNKKKVAKFKIEFISSENEIKCFHKLEASFDQKGLIEETYLSLKINANENYRLVNKRLKKLIHKGDVVPFNYKRKSKSENFNLPNPGFQSVAYMMDKLSVRVRWYFMFSDLTDQDVKLRNELLNHKLMKDVLKTFDTSINDVIKVKGTKKPTYSVTFRDSSDEVIISDGEVQNKNRLSRGTFEALELVVFLSRVFKSEDGIYFLDEKMAFSHSEIERSIIALIINRLGRNAQFFYTTHNYDILDMNLPTHSFSFLRKNEFTEIIHPEKEGFNKNDRTLLNYVKDDVFSTLPETSEIFEMFQ